MFVKQIFMVFIKHQFNKCVGNKADTELGRMTKNEIKTHLEKFHGLCLQVKNTYYCKI